MKDIMHKNNFPYRLTAFHRAFGVPNGTIFAVGTIWKVMTSYKNTV